MRYNLEFRKLTFYGLTRPQSIRKSKQISGQTILSSPQDLEFNPNFAKNRDIPVVKNSVTRPVTPAVLTTKAFDTINHDILLSKLYRYGIRGNPLRLFENYLSNLNQVVKIDDTISSTQTIICGIPQGSTLGPWLFLLKVQANYPSESLLITLICFMQVIICITLSPSSMKNLSQ